jgi:hypothetical protein
VRPLTTTGVLSHKYSGTIPAPPRTPATHLEGHRRGDSAVGSGASRTT